MIVPRLVWTSDQIIVTPANGIEKSGGVIAAGLAVRAEDTGRVLMLQRGVDDEKDPAAGRWEFPGGRLEDDETPVEAARREWREETGLELPDGEVTDHWVSHDGIYHGYVLEVPHETDVDVTGPRDEVEDPDGDGERRESLAWWDPEDLNGNPAVRDELRADAALVHHALGAHKVLGKGAEVFTMSPGGDMIDTVGSDVDESGAPMADNFYKYYLQHSLMSPQAYLEHETIDQIAAELAKLAPLQPYQAYKVIDEMASIVSPPSVPSDLIPKYSSDQPRDGHGRFAPGGGHHSGGGGHGGDGNLTLPMHAAAMSPYRNPKNGKVLAGGTLEGKTYTGGFEIGGVHKNPNGTYSGVHKNSMYGGNQKVILGGQHATLSQAAQAAGQYHAIHVAAHYASANDQHQVASHLANAHSALKVGNAELAHSELTHAAMAAKDGPLKNSIEEVRAAHASLNGIKSEPLVKPPTGKWLKAGTNVDSTQLSLKKNGDVVHKPTDTVIGHVKREPDTPKPGTTTFTATHADGTVTYHGVYKGQAMTSLAQHHNAAAQGGLTTATHQTAQPKTYKDVGQVEYSSVKSNGAGDYVHEPSGVVIGHYKPGAGGGFVATHADGTTMNHGSSGSTFSVDSAKASLTLYHNAKYGNGLIEGPESSAPAKPEPTGPAYHAAGAHVTPSEITVKKTGEIIHKPTGTQLGTMQKGEYYGWKPAHADGTSTIGQFNTKKDAVQQLANHHNQVTAVEQTVKPGQSAEWAKTGKLTVYSMSYAGTTATAGELKVGEHTVGTVKANGDGTVTITHASGAEYKLNGSNYANSYMVKKSLAEAHNQAGEIATGKPLEPAKPAAPHVVEMKPVETTTPNAVKQPYEKVGFVGSSNLVSANVQKDPSGKILSSDMAHNGTIIGHTEANPDGTVKLTHADGHVIDPSVKVGTGQVTGKLSQYHNSKYGDATLTPEPANISSTHTHTFEPVTAQEKAALKKYTGSAYEAINNKLRLDKTPAETRPAGNAGLMHDGIAKSRLTSDITLYRGVTDGVKIFGPLGSNVGKSFTEHGFVSTSTKSSSAFGGDVRMIIHAPAGAHGMDVKSFSHYGHENEVVLQHGTRFTVNSDQMINGLRTIDLTVTGP
jgi:8-oxo-dGTP pyrophosphatase MutT (NUDIX family)